MLKLELNKIPGYSLAESTINPGKFEVTIHFANGGSYPTCTTIEELGFGVEEPEQVKEPETNKVTEETLLSVVAMFTDKKEVPR